MTAEVVTSDVAASLALATAPAPLVKWPGGKARSLGVLRSFVRGAGDFRRYHEPFLGGGALFFDLAPERASVADANVDLIEMYRQVAADPVGVHRELASLASMHDSDRSPGGDFYYGRRDAWNHVRGGWSALLRAATFLYLNRSCFNGLWRVNRDGHMNVPRGDYPGGISIPSVDRMVAAGSLLARARVAARDFEESMAESEEGDLVYADEPYLRLTKGGFDTYAAGGFPEGDHRRLAASACACAERGVHVVISSADVPLAREIYGAGGVLAVHEVSAPRSINSRAGGRGRVSELVFSTVRPQVVAS